MSRKFLFFIMIISPFQALAVDWSFSHSDDHWEIIFISLEGIRQDHLA